MRLTWLAFGLFAIGCGTSTPAGTPQNGNATLQYSGATSKLTAGSAIMDTSSGSSSPMMLVQLGTDGVTCDVDLNGSAAPPQGKFVYFDVDPTTPMTYSDATVSVASLSSSSLDLAESDGGMVTVAAIDTRVTGSVTFNYSTQEAGMIVVTGSFDVEKCF